VGWFEVQGVEANPRRYSVVQKSCHAERSEASRLMVSTVEENEMLRLRQQNDTTFERRSRVSERC
jgi:hypothetical protein